MKKIIIVLCMMLMSITPIYAQEKSLTTYVGALNCFAVDDDVTLKIDIAHPKIMKVVNGNSIMATKAGQTTMKVTIGEQVYPFKVIVKKKKLVAFKDLKDRKAWIGKMNEKQAKQAYKEALVLVKQALSPNKEKTLKRLTLLLRHYFDQMATYNTKGKHYNDPYGYFVDHKVTCAGATRATGLCLNILGYRFEHVNANKYDHQWARTKVGKSYYAVDPFTYICAKEPGVRQLPKEMTSDLMDDSLFEISL